MELKALQYHLYQNPLYEFIDKQEREINIILLGLGDYGKKFLDLCLQVSQCRSEKFTAKIFCSEVEADNYQNERPYLKNFFSINMYSDSLDSYGNIFFEPITTDIISGNVGKIFELSERPNYIFVDLSDDKENKKVAIACRKVLNSLKRKACVSFIWRGTEEKFPRNILPIFISGKKKSSKFYRELERMAFNVHLVWEKNLNVDYRRVKKDFMKPYYHEACIAAVLAIKYKLDDFGADSADLKEAARKFSELVFDEKARNNFIFAEHKRWVTEKICGGWRHREVSECVDGSTKDVKNKKHVCLVKSRADMMLEENFAPEQWSRLSKEDLLSLDELDRVSVRLHKLFVAQAKKAKTEPEVLGSLIENISTTLSVNPKIFMNFNELKVCFEEIFNGDNSKLRLYKSLSETFRQNVSEMPAGLAHAVNENFSVFEKKIRPILLAAEFHDYKKDDAAMVKNIPFILTYSEYTCLIIPLATGKTEQLFENVAAATIINPQKIIYLVFCKNNQNLYEVKNSLPNLLDYMMRKKLHAELEFLIACGDKNIDFEEECRVIKNSSLGKIKRVQFVPIKITENPAPEFIHAFQKFFNKHSRKYSYEFTALEVNDTVISSWLQGGGVCTQVPSYSFDSSTMKFTSINDCVSFAYIRKKNFITVNDLTALNHSFGNIGEQPTFLEDYKILWKKYCENDGKNWKSLCTLLKKHSEKNDIIAVFWREHKTTERYRYLLPAFCFKTVEKICRALIKEEIAGRGSIVRPLNSNACEVIIIDLCNNLGAYDKLFANPYRLSLPEAITFVPSLRKFSVLSDELMVTGLDLSKENKLIVELLKFLRDKNYLTNLETADSSKISFTYATREIKNLLTKEGKMTEVYVYRETKKLGGFDDVVANFEPYWNEFGVHNEFDCVLTKNFNTLFVECKATNDIKQDVYFKLSGLAEKFGVNARTVLVVSDSRELSKELLSRGEELKVVTLQKNLDNVGKILLDLITSS